MLTEFTHRTEFFYKQFKPKMLLPTIYFITYLVHGAPLADEAAVRRHEVVGVELDPRLIREDLQHAATALVLQLGRQPEWIDLAYEYDNGKASYKGPAVGQVAEGNHIEIPFL